MRKGNQAIKRIAEPFRPFPLTDLLKSSKDTPILFIFSSWTGPRLLTQSAIHIWAAALGRYGRPLLVNAIVALYQNGQFFVTDPSGDSPSFPLARGIRH